MWWVSRGIYGENIFKILLRELGNVGCLICVLEGLLKKQGKGTRYLSKWQTHGEKLCPI